MATQRKATSPKPATASSTTRPRTRKAAAPKPAATPPPASSAPIKLYTEQAASQVEMTPLFSIDDVDYLIPKEPNALMALRFLERVKQGDSQEMAMGYLLEDLLGPQSYKALLDYQGHMNGRQLAELFQAAMNAVTGLIELPKDA